MASTCVVVSPSPPSNVSVSPPIPLVALTNTSIIRPHLSLSLFVGIQFVNQVLQQSVGDPIGVTFMGISKIFVAEIIERGTFLAIYLTHHTLR
jgi:hypothetical protein